MASQRLRGGLTVATAAVLLLGSISPVHVRAQEGVAVTTPYPAVSVQPGATASFTLTVRRQTAGRVDLAVEGVPEGWTATLRGGGYEVQGVYVDPAAPPEVTLDVTVPDEATEGAQQLTVVATGDEETASLPLDVQVASAAGGSVEMEVDFPALRGHAEQSFQFSLTLRNDTPQPLTFSLQAVGPQGWDVTAQPTGQETAASVAIDARSTERLTVDVTPPPEAEANVYPIVVEAVSGDHAVNAELSIEITGRVEMQLSTPDQRLNTTATAGDGREFQVVVVNNGTAPLTNVQLSGQQSPTEWEVTFEPATLEEVPPGQTASATAVITPSGDAVAGDYAVTLSASTEEANATLDIRVTVETPPIWGLVGLLLIAAAIGGLFWVFRRFGRR